MSAGGQAGPGHPARDTITHHEVVHSILEGVLSADLQGMRSSLRTQASQQREKSRTLGALRVGGLLVRPEISPRVDTYGKDPFNKPSSQSNSAGEGRTSVHDLAPTGEDGIKLNWSKQGGVVL